MSSPAVERLLLCALVVYAAWVSQSAYALKKRLQRVEPKLHDQRARVRWLQHHCLNVENLLWDGYLYDPCLPNVESTCCEWQTFGAERVCQNSLGSDCFVVSIGCNGEWGYERSIVEQTTCKVHTFDCTGDWTVPKDLEGRVTLHKLCIGDATNIGKNFISFNDMLHKVGQQTAPAHLRMGIDRWEYAVLPAMIKAAYRDGAFDPLLVPASISMELHRQASPEDGLEVTAGEPQRLPTAEGRVEGSSKCHQHQEMMVKHGYHLVSRVDNPFCGDCTDIVWLHERAMPKCREGQIPMYAPRIGLDPK